MREILEKLKTKPLKALLQTYTNAWRDSVATPDLTLYLSSGHVLSGEVIDVDFASQMLTLRLSNQVSQLDIVFVELNKVEAFGLSQIDEYPTFLDLI